MQAFVPPTDNLYKFMAICGLTIFVLSWGYIFTSRESIYDLIYKQKREWTESTAMSKDLKRRSEQIAGLISVLVESLKKNPSLDSKGEFKFWFEQHQSISAEQSKLEAAAEKMSHDVEYFKRYSERQIEYENTAFWLACLGLLLSAFGFYLWYSRVQKFLDIQIKRDAAEDRE